MILKEDNKMEQLLGSLKEIEERPHTMADTFDALRRDHGATMTEEDIRQAELRKQDAEDFFNSIDDPDFDEEEYLKDLREKEDARLHEIRSKHRANVQQQIDKMKAIHDKAIKDKEDESN